MPTRTRFWNPRRRVDAQQSSLTARPHRRNTRVWGGIGPQPNRRAHRPDGVVLRCATGLRADSLLGVGIADGVAGMPVGQGDQNCFVPAWDLGIANGTPSAQVQACRNYF